MLGCNVYVSEGRCAQTLDALQRAASSVPGAHVVWTFRDAAYHRTGFTLAAPRSAPLSAAVVALVGAAFSKLDLRGHAASHPRLGVVDHVSCHPLEPPSTVEAATEVAHAIGRRIGDEFAVPVMLYGSAHPHGRRLAQLRRDAGYFRGEKGGAWQGGVGQMALAADFGPAAACERRGMVCVGAGPWVVNYNVALRTTDLAGARLIARAVSTRGGGPAHVEAMALPNSDGLIEVACNLLDTAVTPQEMVAALIHRLAAEQGVAVHDEYCTNQPPDQLAAAAYAALDRA